MTTTVEDLLSKDFSQRSKKEQLTIIALGPPRPAMQNTMAEKGGWIGRFYERERVFYKMEMWLCGSEKQNEFFCWTCLLFVKKSSKSPWSMPGNLEGRSLRNQIDIHKKCAAHYYGMLQYNIFKTDMSVTPKNIEDDYFSTKNRGVLEIIIDTVCVMMSQISSTSISTNYIDLRALCHKLLHLIKIYYDLDVVNTVCKFIQKNPIIISHIVNSLASVVKKEIKKEVKNSTFVSIILSGHNEVMENNLTLSIVVRYVNEGHVRERLIGFSSINFVETKVTEFIQKLINEFGILERIIAISCDGVVLPEERLCDFQNWLQTAYPKTFFVPCHFHEFHLVLQQSLSSFFPECDLFFRTLRSLKNYFESSPEMCLNIHLFFRSQQGSMLDLSNVKMSDSQFLRFLKLNRLDIIKFFEFATVDSRTVEDFGFISWLRECQTVFLLDLFFRLFEHTAFINEMLGSNSPESVFEDHIIESTLDKLRVFKQYRFVKVCARKNPDSQKSFEVKNVKKRLSELFDKIVQHVIQTIELRFKRTVSLGFLGILDFENKDCFDLSYYHYKVLSAILSVEHPFIFIDHLRTEFKIMGEHGSMTGRKSVYGVMEFLYTKNLHRTFQNMYKLAEFIVSLPCKPVSISSPNTKLDSIKEWASCLQIPESDSISLLCVENCCLDYLKSLTTFYDLVVSEMKLLLNKPKNGR